MILQFSNDISPLRCDSSPRAGAFCVAQDQALALIQYYTTKSRFKKKDLRSGKRNSRTRMVRKCVFDLNARRKPTPNPQQTWLRIDAGEFAFLWSTFGVKKFSARFPFRKCDSRYDESIPSSAISLACDVHSVRKKAWVCGGIQVHWPRKRFVYADQICNAFVGDVGPVAYSRRAHMAVHWSFGGESPHLRPHNAHIARPGYHAIIQKNDVFVYLGAQPLTHFLRSFPAFWAFFPNETSESKSFFKSFRWYSSGDIKCRCWEMFQLHEKLRFWAWENIPKCHYFTPFTPFYVFHLGNFHPKPQCFVAFCKNVFYVIRIRFLCVFETTMRCYVTETKFRRVFTRYDRLCSHVGFLKYLQLSVQQCGTLKVHLKKALICKCILRTLNLRREWESTLNSIPVLSRFFCCVHTTNSNNGRIVKL